MKKNNMTSDREILARMSTEQLDELLQEELHKDNINDYLVRLILAVLESRETDYPIEINENVLAAAKRFEAYDRETMPAKPAKKWNGVIKAAAAFVVVGILTLGIPQVAAAEGVFGFLARWTDSIFEFFDPTNDVRQPEYVFETDHPGLQQVYDAVVEMGITDPVVPRWIPDGYKLEKIEKCQLLEDRALDVSFLGDDGYIYLNCIDHGYQTTFDHEKDKEHVRRIEINGVTHYYFLDHEKQLATWITCETECVLYSNCQEEDFLKMLHSIYAAEE